MMSKALIFLAAVLFVSSPASAFRPAMRAAGKSLAALERPRPSRTALNVFEGGDGEDKGEEKPSVEIEVPKEEQKEKNSGFQLDYDPNTERNFLGLRMDYLDEQLKDPQIVLQLVFSLVLYGLLGYYVLDTIRILVMKN